MALTVILACQPAFANESPQSETATENLYAHASAKEDVHHSHGAISPEKSKEFVTHVGDKIIAIIKASHNGEINKDNDFRSLLKTYFDLPAIGRFALGRYWKLISPAEQQEYLSLFESVTVKTYASQFSEYTNENLKVTGARTNAEKGITVLSHVNRSGHPPLNVNWEISIARDGSMKIEDLIVNGVSMRITQRSEYMSVMQTNQGKISGLIKALRNQIANLNQAEAS